MGHLEESLAKILPELYPLGGRYLSSDDHLVDCSDQGVEFTKARIDVDLQESVKEVKSGQVSSDLLPNERNSLLCIQATRFKCGGVVIGVCIPHILVDASSLGTFIAAWANACRNNDQKMTINPVFNPPTPTLLPREISDSGLNFLESRNTEDSNTVAKMFVFNKEAITSLKSKVRRASRVRVVCALIARALIRLHGAKCRQSPKDWLLVQAVNMRERTSSPLSKHSCGNFATVALCKRSNDMGFEELVEVLGEAIVETIRNYVDRVSSGRESVHQVLLDPMLHLMGADAVVYIGFTDYTKFEFYEADFGWGKPVQTSIEAMPMENHTVLMGNREGDGVEAWVHLNPQDMTCFEQDEEIMAFATWML